ncbi:MAG TPA: RraA family protein [Candidatus Dormibacteraeota bacterium]
MSGVHQPPTTAMADCAAARALSIWLTPPLRTLVPPRTPVSGPAITVTIAPGGGERGLTPLYELLSEALHGGILVIAGAGGIAGAVFGEILARAALQAGLQGAAVDGATRDLPALDGLGFALFASAQHTCGAVGLAHVAATRSPVRIGATPVSDGDLVVLDAGGAVCLPRELEATLRDDGALLAEAEQRILADLAAGIPLATAYTHKRTTLDRIRGVAALTVSSAAHKGVV